MEKTFDIAFNNFIKDNEFSKLPKHKVIYLFRVTIRKEKCWESKVVYIGKADGDDGLSGRVNKDHEHLPDARKEVEKEIAKGNDAFLTIAYSKENKENDSYLERIEAALIFKAQPIINDKCKDSFNYDKTIIKVSGNRRFNLSDAYIAENNNWNLYTKITVLYDYHIFNIGILRIIAEQKWKK